MSVYFQSAFFNKSTSNHIQQALNSLRIENKAKLRTTKANQKPAEAAATLASCGNPVQSPLCTCAQEADTAKLEEDFLTEANKIKVNFSYFYANATFLLILDSYDNLFISLLSLQIASLAALTATPENRATIFKEMAQFHKTRHILFLKGSPVNELLTSFPQMIAYNGALVS